MGRDLQGIEPEEILAAARVHRTPTMSDSADLRL
jgi:hypothetical protein